MTLPTLTQCHQKQTVRCASGFPTESPLKFTAILAQRFYTKLPTNSPAALSAARVIYGTDPCPVPELTKFPLAVPRLSLNAQCHPPIDQLQREAQSRDLPSSNVRNPQSHCGPSPFHSVRGSVAPYSLSPQTSIRHSFFSQNPSTTFFPGTLVSINSGKSRPQPRLHNPHAHNARQQ